MPPGKLIPSTIVTGSTTRIGRGQQRLEGRQRLAGVEDLGADEDADEPDHHQHGDHDLGHGQEPHRVADARTDAG